MQVAYHEQLHAPEGTVVLSVASHHVVDGIQQVAAHHTYLVNDEQVECAYDVAFGIAELVPAVVFA